MKYNILLCNKIYQLRKGLLSPNRHNNYSIIYRDGRLKETILTLNTVEKKKRNVPIN